MQRCSDLVKISRSSGGGIKLLIMAAMVLYTSSTTFLLARPNKHGNTLSMGAT